MKLLVISPHMDDETLGAGGMMLKYAQAGEQVYWLNISNTKTEYGYPQELVDKRREQFQKVSQGLCVCDAIDLQLRPAALSSYLESEIIGKLGKTINKISPDILVTVFPGDIHSDHQMVFNWVKAFSKSFRMPSLKKFLLMEVLSETDFSLSRNVFAPNFFVDISEQMEKKLEILKLYEGEIGQHPFPRSIESVRALATIRGSVAGTNYAEAFMLLREIEK